jgi:uncharacterized peroxidase-related enzyme
MRLGFVLGHNGFKPPSAITHQELNMSRIAIPTRDAAPAASQPILDAVNKQLGFIPNLHRLMSISPAALTGFMGLQGPLSRTIDAKTRGGIALAVSQVNACEYCITAHSYVAAKFEKLSPAEIALNLQGRSDDSKKNAAVHFARVLIETRGKVSDEELASVRDAGFTDAQIVEMTALSAQFLLTNFMNNVADTDIDFPDIDAAAAA